MWGCCCGSCCCCCCCCCCLKRNENKCICYIITEWFFYINHFSLIMFYHSVWLGFELFGSECRCTHIEYSSRSHAEDMTTTNVIIKKKPERKWYWEFEWRHTWKRWAENLVILKNKLVEILLWAGPVQLEVDCGRCRRQLVCLPLRQTVEVEVWPRSSEDLYRQRYWGLRDAQRVCWVR